MESLLSLLHMHWDHEPIVLVLVVVLVLENAETGWDVEDENDDEDETSVHGERNRLAVGRWSNHRGLHHSQSAGRGFS